MWESIVRARLSLGRSLQPTFMTRPACPSCCTGRKLGCGAIRLTKTRFKVEHSIGVIKRIFGFVKVRYRGLPQKCQPLVCYLCIGQSLPPAPTAVAASGGVVSAHHQRGGANTAKTGEYSRFRECSSADLRLVAAFHSFFSTCSEIP